MLAHYARLGWCICKGVNGSDIILFYSDPNPENDEFGYRYYQIWIIS